MHLGITFGQLNPRAFEEVAVAADELGYESAWLPEHLVFPLRVEGELIPGEEHPPVPPTVPIFDACAYLSYLAARTAHLRLGTLVYLLGIRHPFVGARAFATLDVVSGGRAICGVGAGWLRPEWDAVGIDPSTRGARLDEAIGVVRRLWTEPEIAHDGPHFPFEPVAFEPKPVQVGGPPVHVGGESARALRRAATLGDGWLGMAHTPATAAAQVGRLRALAEEAGRDPGAVEVTVMGEVGPGSDLGAWEEAGVDRLIVTPWRRSRDAVEGLTRLAAELGLAPGSARAPDGTSS
ncbi:TIGR03619 family F420-dependent LLM class oxidoreductase [Iamia majanohamensis]|uniref:TIGR03619 family F420-dependent LLM class oxidoreductase n=1 Tax=Iamia majanohamensis TaxID=467976 RepID=A0AAF0BU15_9ACTN|nr:TIGR03619 family F420-dependent LLM class oxidoreductase [Iamia majanohamensis]WCO65543.1 TIGR03619 family F420-dependent LLM class oxidoreductase [Iamia majanohamensis]